MKHIPLVVLLSTTFLTGAAEDWHQFRGPKGDGHATSKNLPVTWSETNQVKWKTSIWGRGWSSPVVWKDQLWVTTANETGTQLGALCLDARSGKILRDLHLFKVEDPQFAHKFNTYASPTPVIEEGKIYVTFGAPATACLDTKTGKVVWERRDLVCNHYRGAGSSPILFGNLLLMNYDGSDFQFIIALDKKTGKTVWKVNRSVDFQDLTPDGKPEAEGDWRKAFSTPHIAEIGGGPQLISSGAKAHYAYDPKSGRELWRVEDRTCHSAATRPVVGDGLIFIPPGFGPRPQLLAIKMPAKTSQKLQVLDVGKTTVFPAKSSDGELEVAWRSARNTPNKPSVLFAEGLLYMIDDNGVASCLEAASGKDVWRERVGGNYSASPIYAAGKIYFFSEEGKATVVEAGRTFKVLATNQLDDGFMASPAVVNNALILRTKTNLYRIE